MLDLSRPLLIAPLPPHSGSTPRPAAIQIRLTEEILAQLLFLGSSKGGSPALGLDLGTRPALILPDNTSYDLTLTAEQKNSELYRLVQCGEGGIDRLESVAGIEIKASVNPGSGKSFEQVGVNLRESRDASEKERESKRTVLLTSTGANSASSSRSPSLNRPKSISPNKRVLPPAVTSRPSPSTPILPTNGSSNRPLSRLSNSITLSASVDTPPPVLKTSTSSTSASSSSSASASTSTTKLPRVAGSKPLPVPVKAPTSSFRIGKGKGVLPILPSRASSSVTENSFSNGKEKIKEVVTGTAATVGRAGGGGVMKGKDSLKKEKQQTQKERERKGKIAVQPVALSTSAPRSEGSDADADADADGDFEEVEVSSAPSQFPTPPVEPPSTVKPDSSLGKKRKLLNGVGVDSPPSTAPTPITSPGGISLARSKSCHSASASASPNVPSRKGKRQVKSERYYTSSEEEKDEEEEERGRGKKMRMSEVAAPMPMSRLPSHLKQEDAQARPSSPLRQSAHLPPTIPSDKHHLVAITSLADFKSYAQKFESSYPAYLKLHNLLIQERAALLRGEEGMFEEEELEKFVKKLVGMARALEEIRDAMWAWKKVEGGMME